MSLSPSFDALHFRSQVTLALIGGLQRRVREGGWIRGRHVNLS